jgi:hypothetical protein
LYLKTAQVDLKASQLYTGWIKGLVWHQRRCFSIVEKSGQ